MREEIKITDVQSEPGLKPTKIKNRANRTAYELPVTYVLETGYRHHSTIESSKLKDVPAQLADLHRAPIAGKLAANCDENGAVRTISRCFTIGTEI